MTDQGIRSRPRYAPLAPDASGRRHLLVLDHPAPREDAFAAGTSPDAFAERWTVAGHSRAIPSPDPTAPMRAYRSTTHLLDGLRARLADERMGLRLYAAGAERFVWDVAGLAEAAGMGRSEYRLVAIGSAARRVFCVHCRTIAEGVTTNVVACPGCGARLFVRDHFSRRMNAYMGVQIDAEVPGDTIPVEELYA